MGWRPDVRHRWGHQPCPKNIDAPRQGEVCAFSRLMGHVRPSKPHETLFSVKVNAQSVKVNDPMRHDDPLLEAFTLTGDPYKEIVRTMLVTYDICELRARLNSDLRSLAKALNNPAGASGNTLQRLQDHHNKPQTKKTRTSVSSHLTQPKRIPRKVS